MVKGSGQSAREAERVIADYERSGLSRRAYSERSGITIARLDWYRRLITSSRKATAIVPVVVERTAGSGAGERGDARGFALVLVNGRRIEAGWNFDESELARLIRIAGAA